LDGVGAGNAILELESNRQKSDWNIQKNIFQCYLYEY
jgi:hypothetical protein